MALLCKRLLPAYWRAVIYAALALVVWAGSWHYERLSLDAENAAEPFTGKPLVYSAQVRAESPASFLSRHGVPQQQVRAILGALGRRLPSRELKGKDDLYLVLTADKKFQRLIVLQARRIVAVAAANGRIFTQAQALPLATVRRAACGEIKSSLWDSMIARGLPPGLVLEFADVFAWNIDFLTETRDGDRFSVLWEDVHSATGRLISSRISAAFYEGRETGRKSAIFHKGVYYTEKGEAMQRMFLRAPLAYRRISSYFSKRRFHPVLRTFRPHLGIDYAAPTGTPVSAIADGRVVFAGRKGGFGNYVEIAHSSGYVSGYGHLSRFAKGVRRGKLVRQGDLIAYVGATGLASGPHLDFRLRHNGKFENFLRIKNVSASGLSGARLAEFKREAEQLLAELSRCAQSSVPSAH